MGMLTKSKRGENDPISFNFDDMNFSISFDNIDKKVKLDEKSLKLLEEAIKVNDELIKTDKKICSGDYKVFLKNDDTSSLWIKAFDKLLEYKLIRKDNLNYVVTDKGKKYLNKL